MFLWVAEPTGEMKAGNLTWHFALGPYELWRMGKAFFSKLYSLFISLCLSIERHFFLQRRCRRQISTKATQTHTEDCKAFACDTTQRVIMVVADFYLCKLLGWLWISSASRATSKCKVNVWSVVFPVCVPLCTLSPTWPRVRLVWTEHEWDREQAVCSNEFK